MSGSGVARFRDIGHFIKEAENPFPSSASGAVNGAAIDRTGFESCVLHAAGGAATGAPTAQTLDAKLQDSADGSTGWADITGAAITQLTADNTEGRVKADLSGAKKFVRVVRTIGFTGGTSPTWPSSSRVILGGAAEGPA